MKLLLVAMLAASAAAISLPGTWGYETANETYGVQYFYWFFDPVNNATNPDDTPLLLWLTGGPGCSSELAMLFENGPYTVDSTGTVLKPNPYGWNNNAYLLYVDQPGGTGFSTVQNSKGYVTDEAQVAADMFTFLTNLFNTYKYLNNRPFYIFGESYAGHYVPAITSYLVQNSNFNIQGMAVGNGFIDPGVQTASFGPFVFSHGLMTNSQLRDTQSGVPQCQKDIAQGNWQAAFNDCAYVLDNALEYCSENKGSQCNVYDITAPCVGQLCYNFNNIVKFLNTKSVQAALGVSGIQWQPCDTTPYSYLQNDFDRSYLTDIPIVLAKNVPVTIYNGNLDIICNFFGEYDVVNSMVWPGSQAFNAATNTTWTVSGAAAGNYRTAQGFTYVVVYNAGHMVPHDQPVNALALVQNVFNNAW